MRNIDRIYHRLLESQVSTLIEIVTIARDVIGRKVSSEHVRKAYIEPLIDSGRAERVRRGLYIIGVPSSQGLRFPTAQGLRAETPDKMLIGSKVSEEGFLGFHSALEVHGASQTMGWRIVYVCVPRSRRFQGFSFRGVEFRPVGVRETREGVVREKHHGQTIRVTSPERTFVDCLDRPALGGGWEEIMKSISELRLRDPDLLLQTTLSRQKQMLIRKVGFVLETLGRESPFLTGVGEETLEELERHVKGPPQYLFKNRALRERLGSVELNGQWRLFVPRDFWAQFVRGV